MRIFQNPVSALFLCILLLVGSIPRPAAGEIAEILRATQGSVESTNASGSSASPSVSADGRYVAFLSSAGNLVPGDTNANRDVFVWDSQTEEFELASPGLGGVPANGYSDTAVISSDGRYVAFMSSASNLVAADTNGMRDIFVYDRQTHEVTLVSRAGDGAIGNGTSVRPSISGDGRYVAFDSAATNLVQSDHNSRLDVFVRDRTLGVTSRVSVKSDGTEGNETSLAPSISADGTCVAFESTASNLVAGDTNGVRDIFVHQGGVTTRVSLATGGAQGNGHSTAPSLSADGRYVAFTSTASNFAVGDNNGTSDIFRYDRFGMGSIQRVSWGPGFSDPNGASFEARISGNGQVVVYSSDASNLAAGDNNAQTDVFRYDTMAQTTSRISVSASGQEGNFESQAPAVSYDGQIIFFSTMASTLDATDTNSLQDVYGKNAGSGALTRVSKVPASTSPDGVSYVYGISADGQKVLYSSIATNLVFGDTNGWQDVFVYDTHTRQTARVSVAEDGGQLSDESMEPAISADGRYVAFASLAALPGDSNGAADVLLKNLETGELSLISKTSGGASGNGQSSKPALSSNGRYIAFVTDALDLAANDGAPKMRIVLRDTATGTTTLVCLNSAGQEGDLDCTEPHISGDGRYVLFVSLSSNLVGGDSNGRADLFVRDMTAGTTERVNVADSGAESDGNLSGWDISPDGRYVAFGSTRLDAPENPAITRVYLRDRVEGHTLLISRKLNGTEVSQSAYIPTFSRDGLYLSFFTRDDGVVSGDTNGWSDLFIYTLATGGIERVSIGAGGLEGNGDTYRGYMSDNRSYTAFYSDASNLFSSSASGPTEVGVAVYDFCLEDPNKSEAGACGCGIPDTDSDGDSVPDCAEECDADPAKTGPGVCGCAIGDSDGNGNGVADCLDPGTGYRPAKPKVKVTKRGAAKKKVTITLEARVGVRYHVSYGMNRVRKPMKTKLVGKEVLTLRLPAGAYWVRYRMKAGTDFTQYSKKRAFKVK